MTAVFSSLRIMVISTFQINLPVGPSIGRVTYRYSRGLTPETRRQGCMLAHTMAMITHNFWIVKRVFHDISEFSEKFCGGFSPSPPSGHLLAAARSPAGSCMPLACNSIPAGRFATQRGRPWQNSLCFSCLSLWERCHPFTGDGEGEKGKRNRNARPPPCVSCSAYVSIRAPPQEAGSRAYGERRSRW